jgi:hypothetical protein
VWGDPALYDSTLRIIEQIVARGTLAQAMDKPGWNAYYDLGIGHCTPSGRTVS